jgi:hypothetical protein
MEDIPAPSPFVNAVLKKAPAQAGAADAVQLSVAFRTAELTNTGAAGRPTQFRTSR